MKFITDILNKARESLQHIRWQMAEGLSNLVPDKHTVIKAVLVVVIGIYALLQPHALEYIAPFFGLSMAILFIVKTRRWLLGILMVPFITALILVPYWLMYKLVIPAVYDWTLNTYNHTELGLILVWTIATAVGFLLSILIVKFASRKRTILLGITWLIVGSIGAAAWYADNNDELRTWQLATYVAANVEVLEHLPPTVNRMMPQITAKGQTLLDNGSNLYVPDNKPHLAFGADGKAYWCSPLKYKDNIFYNILGMVRDLICIDANKTDMEASATTVSAGQDGFYEIVMRLFGLYEAKPGDGFFWMGDHSFITNAVLKLRHPFSTKDRVIYGQRRDGTRHYLMNYVSRCPYGSAMVPCEGGVLDVSTSGWITDLSVKDAEKLYPKDVFISADFATTLIKAYAEYYTGIISKKLNQQHAGVMQISMEPRPKELNPDDFNPAPYITEFKRDLRPQQVATLEPAGAQDGKKLKAVVLVDNYGHLRIFEPKVGSGPAMAMTYVHNADPRVDWGHKIPIEDKIVIGENDQIFFLVAVVNDNPRYPLYISALVEASSFTAHAVHDANELETLLKHITGQAVEPAPIVPVAVPVPVSVLPAETKE